MSKLSTRSLQYFVVIVASYCVSFISITAIIIYDPQDDFAVFLSYSVFFATSLLINYFFIRRFLKYENQANLDMRLLSGIISNNTLFAGLLDVNLSIVRVFHNSSSKTLLHEILSDLFGNEDLFRKISIRIRCFFEDKDKFLNIPVRKEVPYIIRLTKTEDPNILGIKITKADNEYLEAFYDDMPFAFFQTDEFGAITMHNRNFDMVFDENVVNIDKVFDKSFNWLSFEEGVVYFAGKSSPYFLFCYDRHENFPKKSKSIFFKPHSKYYGLDEKQIKEDWINYTWEYFFEKSPYAVLVLNENIELEKFNGHFERFINTIILKGDKFINLIASKDIERFQDLLSIVSSQKETIENSMDISFKDNDKIFKMMIARIVDPQGSKAGYILRIIDITQQKKLEASFSHAQRMQTIGHLVGSVAHDFNNILTVISGFCDLLLLRHSIGDPSFGHVMHIKQSADRASQLVRKLLAFSRKQTLQLQSINPIDLFSEFTPLISRLIGSRTKFSQKIDPEVWYFSGDIVQMEQVILNLVVNAQQAMQNKDGMLNIVVDNFNYLAKTEDVLKMYSTPEGESRPEYGRYVRIVIKDNGLGISQENLKKIFEPFFTTKNDKTGSGFGLSTVYGILHQSNAHILVKSEVGVGTEFMMLFPRIDPPKQEVISLEETKNKENSIDLYGKQKILLVEDEDAIRIFAKKVLQNKGYEVVDFNSAQLALNTMQGELSTIDLVISDVLMPEMSGPTLATALQAIRPDIKILFISGYAEEAFTAEYGQSREFHFIPKPFSLKQLLIKVKEVLSSDGQI